MYSKVSILVDLSCVAFAVLISLASCRKYVFPMCPPEEWLIPGGKVKSQGTVNYKLKCDYGYITPFQHDDDAGHDCVNGKPSKLLRQCVAKFFAYVTIQYGIAFRNSDGNNRNACSDVALQQRIKTVRFYGINFGRGHDLSNSQITPTMLRAGVGSCFRDGGVHYMRIYITNVPQANGTEEQMMELYNFVLSETFLYIKRRALLKMGYKMTKAKASGLQLFQEVTSFSLENAFAKREKRDSSRQQGFGSPIATTDNDFQKGSNDDTQLLYHGHSSAGYLPNGRHSSHPAGFQGRNRLAGNDIHPTTDLPEKKSRVKRAHDVVPDFPGYLGLFEASINPVGYTCPDHLVMKIVNTTEYLCVGCGRGWIMKQNQDGPKCYPCGPGFYSDTDTASSCLPCPIKYVNSPWDAGSIDDCFKVDVSPETRKKWTLVGYFMPLTLLALLTGGVAYVSKVTIGTSSYRPASQRKVAKQSGNKAASEMSTSNVLSD